MVDSRRGSIQTDALGSSRAPALSRRTDGDGDKTELPGAVLARALRERGLSASELARRCGRSPKMIVEIIAGKAPIEPETAIQLGRVLGSDPTVWMDLETNYRLRLAKTLETSRIPDIALWLGRFPIREMVVRKMIPGSDDPGRTIRQLLGLFGTGSVEALEQRLQSLANVRYRHSPSFRSSEGAIQCWLLLGEKEAELAETRDYDRKAFIDCLSWARNLTGLTTAEFYPRLRLALADAGVVLVISRPFQQMALSGVAKWMSPRRALIQQTMRYKRNDQFWFTFFHEAAHILLHSRKEIFIDGDKDLDGGHAEAEREANEWASSFLVPVANMTTFIRRGDFTKSAVVEFAKSIGIAPGVVVGQLQNRQAIPFRNLNDLKVSLEFPAET